MNNTIQVVEDENITSAPSPSWTSRRSVIGLFQILIIAIILIIWQYVPTIGWVSHHVRFLNRFYISSPSQIARGIRDLAIGSNGSVLVWSYLRTTVESTLVGSAIGMILGAIVGLILSNNVGLSRILQPFIAVMNSVPRVALIPIFILIAGPTVTSEVISVVAVVFFLGFFNAYEGGRSVRGVTLEYAKVLGASPWKVILYVRMPAVLEWTFAAVPNALSFALVVSVTTELLAGIPGMGYLLLTATTNIDATLTFSLIVILGVVGVFLFYLSSYASNRVVHWRGR